MMIDQCIHITIGQILKNPKMNLCLTKAEQNKWIFVSQKPNKINASENDLQSDIDEEFRYKYISLNQPAYLVRSTTVLTDHSSIRTIRRMYI